jgi:hypothetical protein
MLVGTLAFALGGCGQRAGTGDTPRTVDAPPTDVSYDGVAPAGADATIVMNTIPSSMVPGDHLLVTVQVHNAGTVDWVKGAGWMLHWVPNTTFFSWADTPIPANVPAGTNVTFQFPIVVPSGPSPTSFVAKMFFNPGGSGGFFGQTLSVPVAIGGTTKALDASLVSGAFPASILPGATASAVFVVKNVGTQAWTPTSNFYFYQVNNPVNTWGRVNYAVSSSISAVAPGGQVSFSVTIKAPTAEPFPTDVRFQMFDSGVGFFGPVFAFPIKVGCVVPAGWNPLNSNYLIQLSSSSLCEASTTMPCTDQACGPGPKQVTVTLSPSMPGLVNYQDNYLASTPPGFTGFGENPSSISALLGTSGAGTMLTLSTTLPGANGPFCAVTQSAGSIDGVIDTAAGTLTISSANCFDSSHSCNTESYAGIGCPVGATPPPDAGVPDTGPADSGSCPYPPGYDAGVPVCATPSCTSGVCPIAGPPPNIGIYDVTGSYNETLGDSCTLMYPQTPGMIGGTMQVVYAGIDLSDPTYNAEDNQGGTFTFGFASSQCMSWSQTQSTSMQPVLYCPWGSSPDDFGSMTLGIDPATGNLTYSGSCAHSFMCSDWSATMSLTAKFRCVPGQTVCWKGSVVTCNTTGTVTSSAPCGLPCGTL